MPESTYEITVTLKTTKEAHSEFILRHMEEFVTTLYPNNVVNISTAPNTPEA